MIITTQLSAEPVFLLHKVVLWPEAEPLTLPIESGHLAVARAAPTPGTTLARAVVGLTKARSGKIMVNGRDVSTLPPGRRQIGYVPAGGALLPHLTVKQNIEYGQRSRVQVRVIAEKWLNDLVDHLDLTSLLGRRPHQLSPVHRFRVAIARAAVSRPDALVVDRPDLTGGIDRLSDLIERVTPPGSPGLAVLVCSSQATSLAEADRCVELPADPDGAAPVVGDSPETDRRGQLPPRRHRQRLRIRLWAGS